jgi:hypothetical protein
LTLTSYSTIDLYGTGEFGGDALRNLTLQAGGITRGTDSTSGNVVVRAGNVLFANPSNVAQSGNAQATTPGTLEFNTSVIRFGVNSFGVSGYENVVLNATGGMLSQAKSSDNAPVPLFSVAGNLTMNAPVITGAGGSTQQITAGGTLVLGRMDTDATVRGGLGSSLVFTGGEIQANGNVMLPSGQVTLRATTGDVSVGGILDVTGTRRQFFDVIRYSGGGNITLTSDSGNVSLDAGSKVSVAALEQLDDGVSGSAGVVKVNATNGAFTIAEGASLNGSAGEGKASGSFILDAGSLPDFAELGSALNVGGFLETRNFRVRTGDVVVSSVNAARKFILSTDQGDIRVTGTGVINAGGETGGNISLVSQGNLTLENGALLTVHAKEFSSAGNGGDIYLAAGSAIAGSANLNAMLDLQAGSTVDLGVDAFQSGDFTKPGSSAFNGEFTGTLHLRAPRNAANSDVNVATIGGTIKGGSSILVEGYEVLDLTNSDGLITGSRSNATSLPSVGTVQRTVYDRASEFLSNANYDGMVSRILGSDSQGLLSAFVLAPGVEITNTSGDLTIGAAGSTSLAGDWNLADFRFGTKQAPGILTLRAAGDIVLNNSLSDGFAAVTPAASNGNSMLWLAQMSTLNPNLPVNTQSWSFHLVAGSDLASADYHSVLPTGSLASGKGSLLLGEFYPAVPNTTPAAVGTNGTTANTIGIASGGTRYEVIRTGTGDIDIAAACRRATAQRFCHDL